jgi:hypothetical protein
MVYQPQICSLIHRFPGMDVLALKIRFKPVYTWSFSAPG